MANDNDRLMRQASPEEFSARIAEMARQAQVKLFHEFLDHLKGEGFHLCGRRDHGEYHPAVTDFIAMSITRFVRQREAPKEGR
jgi:hypothetical protein